MNRKLIRTTLAEVKERESHQRETANSGGGAAGGVTVSDEGTTRPRGSASSFRERGSSGPAGQSSQTGGRQPQQRRAPPIDTNAETFYYKKQMDAHTTMVILLQDGEEIEGTIEWYDRNALKINRQDAPNLLLLKHNIKYMYKAEDRDREEAAESGE